MTDREIEIRRQKAKSMRYMHPIMNDYNLDTITENLYDMQEDCGQVQWAFDAEGNDMLEEILGSDDDAQGFKVEFGDLEYQLEQFQNEIQDEWVPEYFDLMMVGKKADGEMLGYDEFIQDYFPLSESWELEAADEEAQKKLMKLTKKDLINGYHRVLQIIMSYTSLRFRYQCLKYTIDTIKEVNGAEYDSAKAINELYEEGEACEWKDCETVYKFGNALRDIPDKVWLQ